MDRLISEQAVIDAVSEWLYDKTRKESIETVIKAIPSAYKGMTNGEVIEAVFPKSVIRNEGKELIGVILSNDNSEQFYTRDWWNSPYDPQERSDKE